MDTLVWIGIAILAIALLGWLVFKITLWFAGLLLVAGVVLMVWGALKVKRTV